jgi:hypothetical protein
MSEEVPFLVIPSEATDLFFALAPATLELGPIAASSSRHLLLPLVAQPFLAGFLLRQMAAGLCAAQERLDI